jgi:GR25 family glycosyltransferase involved in LPS biosynthesis
MTLNNFFDKIVCINLDNRLDRWIESTRIFQKQDLTVERIPAIYGKDLNIPTEHDVWYHGVLGCSLSHLFAVKYARQLNLNNILILEDDVDFIENVNERFDDILPELPEDWDMLYFGGNHFESPRKISPHISRLVSTVANHAIALNGKFFETAIKALTNINTINDVNYQELQKDYNIFVTNPHLAWQRPGYSSILERHEDYSFMKEYYE